MATFADAPQSEFRKAMSCDLSKADSLRNRSRAFLACPSCALMVCSSVAERPSCRRLVSFRTPREAPCA